MKGFAQVVLAVAIGLPAVVMGQQQPAAGRPQQPQFDYNYVEIGYDEADFDVRGAGDIDGDGLSVAGSFEINDEWHVFASYGTADLDFGIDLDRLALGAGYTFPLKQDIDLYGRVLYLDHEVDLPGPGNADDDGLGLQFRIRARVSSKVEVEGGAQYVDIGDSDLSLQASARYHFTQQFSAGIGLTLAGDADGIGINARFSF